MLEEKDVDKIIEANNQVFATKVDLEGFRDEIRELFSNLQTSVDT